MLQFKHPKKIKAGDELIDIGLKISNEKRKTRLTFNWGDDSIKVIGANMVRPNVFEFKAVKNNESNWFIKYCASQDAKPSKKRLYVTVEEIRTRKLLIWLMRGIGILFLILPVLIFIFQTYYRGRYYNFFNFSINIGDLTLSVPVMLAVTIFLWSKKTSEYISRLMTVSQKATETEIVEYQAKGMSYIPIEILSQNDSELAENKKENFSDWITIKPHWYKSEVKEKTGI